MKFRIFVFLSCLIAAAPGPASSSPPGEGCIAPGRWVVPATGAATAAPDLIARMARRPVVLLGETHTDRDDHRWQAQVLAALHARNPNMVVAFEAFPRAAKPVLDRWIRGELSEKAFLRDSRWNDVWRFDPSLYMDLFHFARMNRVPMVAMNVDRAIVTRIRQKGWDAVPTGERGGIGKPAPAPAAYVADLGAVFREHAAGSRHGKAKADAPSLADPAFRGFVEAQTAWDRAMAEALAAAHGDGNGTLVVGIVGRGHLEYGHGIVHQLADLGVRDAATLLPWQPGRPCADMTSKDGTPVADAVFGMSHAPVDAEPPRPMLGVMIEPAPKDGPTGVRVRQVVPGGVAEAAGLKEDDIIQQAAGSAVADNARLVGIIRRQAPGTWLPLRILRDERAMDVVAKFPAAPQTDP